MNVTLSSTLTLRFSSFVKRKTKFFGHLYTSKVSTKTYTYDSTMWCVRVCICYVGWQNTSYTVDTACTPSLSGLATAINRCTLFLFHCEMPPRDSQQARTGCRSFLQGQVNPASEAVRRRVSIGEAFSRLIFYGSIGIGDCGLVSSME